MDEKFQTKQPNRHRARSQASEILDALKYISPPVKLSSVVELLNISTIKGDSSLPFMKKVSAFIELESKLLIYNPNDSVVRQRFSVAHEIGHYVMKHSVGTDIFSLNSKDYREIEANMFASELLIPFKWIKADLKCFGASIPDLARKYWVSDEAMGWRISNSDTLLLI